MEFHFNLNDFLANELVTKINSNLLPVNFSGDRRRAVECSSVLQEVLDDMGVASAKAQALVKPITSGEKLRNSDHTVYLLMEENHYGNRTVVGLLKIGPKNLYVYDESGHIHERKTICVLDFYVHETKQRMGHGKILYDYMLQDIGFAPYQLAIDKPSDKFLSFLYKHYGLEKIVPQTNNFVLFEGFFDTPDKACALHLKSPAIDYDKLSYETESNHNYTDSHSIFDDEYGLSKYGRHAAYKHTSSVGQCMSWEQKDNGSCLDVDLPLNSSTNGDCEHVDLKYHHSQLW